MFKRRSVHEIADMICGNADAGSNHFKYRSSGALSDFFEDCGTSYVHDGTTRKYWVAERLIEILALPRRDASSLPDEFCAVIRTLMDPRDAINEDAGRPQALAHLNASLASEGYEAFYGQDGLCYVRHKATNSILAPQPNPHRPFSANELARRERLVIFLTSCSEDELIEKVLLPLFRQLGFSRITAAGHKDKQLEYGKDIWMRYVLPTAHVLYFGIQVKKGKLDAAGFSKSDTANIAEIHNQANMMLGHEVFDPEFGKRVLVDHAFIIAGGEITKAARNWIGGKLDAAKRSQIMFMDREDILNLFVVSNLSPPEKDEAKNARLDDEPPF